jgi:NADH-quinone oxidoreductase subunit G
MCEKCVRVSNEITGNELLEVKMGGYGSTIINHNPEANEASLGESVAVCPVGALVNNHFKYSANAWELSKIPSTCAHCSVGCALYYEVKNDKIYRVGNDAEFATLCGAGRYGFDFANKVQNKDKEAFTEAIKAFEDAKSIVFSSTITNEEAYILQQIKQKTGAKLISPQAKAYQDFLQSYSQITGKSLYNGNLEDIKNSSVVVVFGTRIAQEAPVVKYHINMASKHNRARVVYMHPLEDTSIQNIVTQFIKYEVGSEEGVAALLAYTLLQDKDLTKTIKKFIDNLDIGYLSAESNVGEEELEVLAKTLQKKSGFSLVVGSDLYTHPRAKEIAKLLGLLELYTEFKVVLVPPTTNALGVASICELDSEVVSPSVGYNADADFVLSSLGDGQLDMPVLNQQEGTITTLNKQVVPLNVAQPYNGYILNDIANELGVEATYTIDYTKELPTDKGFKSIEFDELANRLDELGNDIRGYMLDSQKVSVARNFDDVAELETYDGAVIYHANSPEQFNAYTNKSPLLEKDTYLVGSQAFANASKLKDGESVSFKVGKVVCERTFKVDETMKGTIAINPIFDIGVGLFELEDYRFERLSIIRNT